MPIDDVAQDRLGFRVIVSALRRFLDNPDTVPPLVVSINGPWGSGKSSIMKMLARELMKTGRFQTVWFNAWQYHEEPQILPAFLHTIAYELGNQRKLGFSLRLAGARARQFSLWQYLLLTGPLAIVVVSLWVLKQRPELLHNPWAFLLELIKSDPVTNVTKVITLVVAAVGAMAGLWTVLSAFRLRFAKLFVVTDESHAAIIDDFTREFRVYRDAAGQSKFLFVIDDLDRCPPDKVVAVLKAINLIVTSADEAGRSFFVLGFAQDYIIRSIEQYFRNLAPSGFEHEEQFGQEYLKKMVTLSVSVPKPNPAQMRELLADIDSANAGELPPATTEAIQSWMQQAVARFQNVPVWAWRLATSLAFSAIVAVAAAGMLNEKYPVRTPPTRAVTNVTPVEPASLNVIEMPTLKVMPGHVMWWLWGIPAAMAFLAGGLLIASTRPSLVERSYLRQKPDSDEFKDAVERGVDLLPSNPRDMIRTINLMRMEFLLQSSPVAPFFGSPLTEWECVSFTLLQQRRPWMFESLALERKIIPDLKSAAPPVNPEDFYSKISFDAHVGADVAGDIARLQRSGGSVQHFVDPVKLQRYADLNRYKTDDAYRLE
jgi:hypothetical protein